MGKKLDYDFLITCIAYASRHLEFLAMGGGGVGRYQWPLVKKEKYWEEKKKMKEQKEILWELRGR